MYEHILVAIDGSPTAERGLDEAVKLAKLCGGSLRLIHVVDPIPFTTGYEALGSQTGQEIASIEAAGQRLLDASRDRAVANGATNVDTVLVERSAERVAERIVEQAKSWAADLIVTGTHGRRGLGRVLIGSDAEQTVRISPVPVLLVRAPEEAGPA